MALHVFLFLLVVCLLSLALLWRLGWLRLPPSHSQGWTIRSGVHRRLLPRTPLDCPACRLASTPASGVEPTPVRPWREVKSRRGAPKRVNTEGFACPNQQCAYFGITDAHIHALVGDGKHGQAEWIQTFRGPACHTTFSARRHTPLYRLKPLPVPGRSRALCAGRRAGCFRSRTRLRLSSGDYYLLADSCWRARTHLARALLPPSLAPSPPAGPLLRTRLRSSKHVLWLWLAIDPRSKLVPVLHLGPRTQHAAHLVIHSLRESRAPGCIPLFTSDGLNLYFYALTAHLGHWLQAGRHGRTRHQWQVEADLIYGQVKKC
jgi:hypothetical protein